MVNLPAQYRCLQKWLTSDEGQDLAEYPLIVLLIIVIGMVTMPDVGRQIALLVQAMVTGVLNIIGS